MVGNYLGMPFSINYPSPTEIGSAYSSSFLLCQILLVRSRPSTQPWLLIRGPHQGVTGHHVTLNASDIKYFISEKNSLIAIPGEKHMKRANTCRAQLDHPPVSKYSHLPYQSVGLTPQAMGFSSEGYLKLTVLPQIVGALPQMFTSPTPPFLVWYSGDLIPESTLDLIPNSSGH